MSKTLCLWIVLSGVLAITADSGALAADATARQSQQAATPAVAGNNLQVLPKDTSQTELLELMARYTQELGVACTFCHAQNAQTQAVDFASDENPMKQVARIMIGMVHDINHKYLSQVGDRRYAKPISCGNCHQGQTYPPEFDPASHP
jgi:Photosynthetic reaction centre cytochrome C subunit